MSVVSYNNDNSNFYYLLSNLTNILQIANFQINIQEISNDELMKYLQHQDDDYLKAIIKQNELIIKQNEEIISLLKNYKGG